jgi:hypothetical protein
MVPTTRGTCHHRCEPLLVEWMARPIESNSPPNEDHERREYNQQERQVPVKEADTDIR